MLKGLEVGVCGGGGRITEIYRKTQNYNFIHSHLLYFLRILDWSSASLNELAFKGGKKSFQRREKIFHNSVKKKFNELS